MSTLTMGEINQLNIDLAFHQARVKTSVDKQRQHQLFAFGMYDAPSERVQQESFETYWGLEKDIQESLTKIQKIKEQLR